MFFDCHGEAQGDGIMPCPQLSDPGYKQVLTDTVIPAIIGKVQPRFVAIASSAWIKSYDLTNPAEKAQQAADEATYGNRMPPDVQEALVVMAFSEDGEAATQTALINRTPTGHPVLVWQEQENCKWDDVEGCFADAVKRSLLFHQNKDGRYRAQAENVLREKFLGAMKALPKWDGKPPGSETKG